MIGAALAKAGVNWTVAGQLVIAWVLTIPCAALVAAVAWHLAGLLKHA